MASISLDKLPSDKSSKLKKWRKMAMGGKIRFPSRALEEIARPRLEVPPYTLLTKITQKPKVGHPICELV